MCNSHQHPDEGACRYKTSRHWFHGHCKCLCTAFQWNLLFDTRPNQFARNIIAFTANDVLLRIEQCLPCWRNCSNLAVSSQKHMRMYARFRGRYCNTVLYINSTAALPAAGRCELTLIGASLLPHCIIHGSRSSAGGGKWKNIHNLTHEATGFQHCFQMYFLYIM